MRTAIICIIGLAESWGHAAAAPLIEGRVRLESGGPAAGTQVMLFDLDDLRSAPVAASEYLPPAVGNPWSLRHRGFDDDERTFFGRVKLMLRSDL